MNRFVRDVTCLAIAAALSLSGGCQSPGWEQSKETRTQEMRNTTSYFVEHERQGPDRINRTMGSIERSHEYHVDHLARTGDVVRSEWEYDKTRWTEERPKRRAFASRYWHGKPETIPSTWAKMVY